MLSNESSLSQQAAGSREHECGHGMYNHLGVLQHACMYMRCLQQVPQQYTAQSRIHIRWFVICWPVAFEIEDACLILESLPAHHLLAAE